MLAMQDTRTFEVTEVRIPTDDPTQATRTNQANRSLAEMTRASSTRLPLRSGLSLKDYQCSHCQIYSNQLA